jgi:hypothetical protein
MSGEESRQLIKKAEDGSDSPSPDLESPREYESGYKVKRNDMIRSPQQIVLAMGRTKRKKGGGWIWFGEAV